MTVSVQEALAAAVGYGHSPGLYRRGHNTWRVHLDVAGAQWKDCKTLDEVATWLMRQLSKSQEDNLTKPGDA